MKLRIAIALALASTALVGCRGQTSQEAPVVVLRNMWSQPKYSNQGYSAFFEDGRQMRVPVAGTFAREMELNPAVSQGRTVDGTGFVDTVPPIVIQRNGGMEKLLERGEQRYGIYCTPCHDGLGNGNGMVIQRANLGGFKPPTFHDQRVRTMPDGQLFQTISYGYNNMPAYGQSMPVDDRWAVVAYVRALQLSQATQASNAGATP